MIMVENETRSRPHLTIAELLISYPKAVAAATTLNHVKVASTSDVVGTSDAFSDADFYEECSRFEDVILKFST